MILLELFIHIIFFVSVETKIEDASLSNLSIDLLDQTVEGEANGF